MANPNNSGETSLRQKVGVGLVGGLALLGVGSRINATLDNDRVFHTGPAVSAEPATHPEKQDPTVSVVAKAGDSPWSIAKRYVKSGEDIRPLVDRIESAAGSDGLQAGEEVTFKP